MNCRIPFHQLPFHSLLKAAPQQFVNIPYRTGADFFIFGFPGYHCRNRRSLQQLLVIFLQKAGVDIRKFFIANQRQDIVIDQRHIAFVSRNRLLIFSIKIHIFPEQVLHGFTLGNDKRAALFFILDFLLPLLCLGLGGIGLPFLLSLPIGIRVIVDHTEFVELRPDFSPLFSDGSPLVASCRKD